MKTFLPWVLVVALLAGVYFLYSQIKDKDSQIARLSEDSLQLAQARAENEELKKIPLQQAELDRLRKEHDELLRLRAETQRSRGQIKDLTAQLASAQAQSSAVQAQNEKAQQARQLAAEQQAAENLIAQNQQQQSTTENKLAQEQLNVCINFLRQIDGAKQQWALENKKTANDIPTPEDLAPYLRNPGQIICPAGGTYSINAVGVPPTCSVPSHALK